VLGNALSPVAGLDLALEGLVYELNGAVAATNTAAEVMAGPVNSLAWIANHGDAVRASYTRLGSVAVRFV
jgi:2-keto-4-pentenoate hydratase